MLTEDLNVTLTPAQQQEAAAKQQDIIEKLAKAKTPGQRLDLIIEYAVVIEEMTGKREAYLENVVRAFNWALNESVKSMTEAMGVTAKLQALNTRQYNQMIDNSKIAEARSQMMNDVFGDGLGLRFGFRGDGGIFR